MQQQEGQVFGSYIARIVAKPEATHMSEKSLAIPDKWPQTALWEAELNSRADLSVIRKLAVIRQSRPEGFRRPPPVNSDRLLENCCAPRMLCRRSLGGSPT